MRKADLRKRCRSFLADLDRITDRTNRLEKQIGRRGDRRWAYEMLAVSAVTAWSDFAEDIFYGSINRDSSALAKTVGLALPKHLALPLCEALFTTRGYLDLGDVGNLKGTAKKYVGAAHPFKGIQSATSQAIDRLIAVRNFIVHGSRVARATYLNKVLKPKSIRNLVAPGRFLMAKESGRTRLA